MSDFIMVKKYTKIGRPATHGGPTTTITFRVTEKAKRLYLKIPVNERGAVLEQGIRAWKPRVGH